MAASLPPATAPIIASGTYAYRASVNGAQIGGSTIVVKHDGTSTEIDEQSNGTYNGMAGQAAAELHLGADLAPTGYQNSYQAGGMAGKASVAFSGASANLTGPMGSQSFNLAGDAKHFAVIDGAQLAGFIALPAEMSAWNGTPVTAIVPVYGQAFPITPDASAKPAHPASVPASDAVVSVAGSIPFTVWYDPSTYIADEIDVPSQGIVVTRVKT